MNNAPTLEPETVTEVWLREQALKDAQYEQRRLLRLISQRVERASGHIAQSEADPGKLNAKLSAYLRHVALQMNDLEKMSAGVARGNARNLSSHDPDNLLERTLDELNGRQVIDHRPDVKT